MSNLPRGCTNEEVEARWDGGRNPYDDPVEESEYPFDPRYEEYNRDRWAAAESEPSEDEVRRTEMIARHLGLWG
jgi:hypothetical protein